MSDGDQSAILVGFIRIDNGSFQACDLPETAQEMVRNFNDGRPRQLAWRFSARFGSIHIVGSVADLRAAMTRYEPPKREMELE